jgi:hypothetical protein
MSFHYWACPDLLLHPDIIPKFRGHAFEAHVMREGDSTHIDGWIVHEDATWVNRLNAVPTLLPPSSLRHALVHSLGCPCEWQQY